MVGKLSSGNFCLLQINTYMNRIVKFIVSTRKGWIIRQILKYVAMGGTALTSWLLAQGADASNAELIVTGLTTAITGTLEVAFSKLASTVAAE